MLTPIVAKMLLKKWKRIHTMDCKLRDNNFIKVTVRGNTTTTRTYISRDFSFKRIEQAERIIKVCESFLSSNTCENETKKTTLE